MNLPPPIAAYVAASNAHDAAALAALFAEDAIVQDEARDWRGRAEIERWMRDAIGAYAMTMAPQAFAPDAAGGVLTARIFGSFPGSPVVLRYAFALEGDRIAGLAIAP